MDRQQLIKIIELLERLENIKQLWVGEPSSDPVTKMSLFLMKQHLTGRVTTPTSLAQSADIPYTTATRRVSDMRNQGLLDMRPRTASGKSFSVHPSPKLISKVTSLLTSTRAAVSAVPAAKPGDKRKDSLMADGDIIETPPIASTRLGFAKGLDILVPNDPAYSIGKPLRRELSYLMGGQVRFAEAAIDTLRQDVLQNHERKESKYDVIAVDLPMISEFAHKGVLTQLDQFASDSELNSADFISAAWRGAKVGGRQYAIPILINPQLLFYRTDLFASNNLQPPTTTDEVLQAARCLNDPSKGIYGVSWTGARGGPVGQAFVQFLADFGQPIFELERSIGGYRTSGVNNQLLKPQINTEIGDTTARFMTELLKYSPPDVLSMGWGGQVDLLRNGKVGMAYEWASRAAQLSGYTSAGELDFLPHPIGQQETSKRARSRVAPIGGFAFGIPANISPKRLRIAWNAIEWLASPQVIKLLVQHGGLVTPRISVGSDPEVQQLSPMISAVDRMSRRGEIRLWPRPPVASYSQVIQILGEEIHDMLCGRQSIPEALERSQLRAEEMG